MFPVSRRDCLHWKKEASDPPWICSNLKSWSPSHTPSRFSQAASVNKAEKYNTDEHNACLWEVKRKTAEECLAHSLCSVRTPQINQYLMNSNLVGKEFKCTEISPTFKYSRISPPRRSQTPNPTNTWKFVSWALFWIMEVNEVFSIFL